MISAESLELVDLRNNPLTRECHELLQTAKVGFEITVSDRVKEDWENLDV